MSEWNCEVVKLGPIVKHPNADTLGITEVFGCPVIVKLGDYQEGDLVSYISVDTLVPVNHDYFKFLDNGKGKAQSRIKARKLRGIFSMGLVVPLPNKLFNEGDNVEKIFGLEKYLPPAEKEYSANNTQFKKSRVSETRSFDTKIILTHLVAYLLGLVLIQSTPLLVLFAFLLCLSSYGIIKYNRHVSKRPNYPMYDLDGFRRYPDVFIEGEPVWVSEKVHGCNVSFCNTGRKFHVKSRTIFREDSSNSPSIGDYQPKKDVYHKVAKAYDLKNKLAAYPGVVLYGEVFGKVQDLNYGVKDDEEVRLVVYDAMYLETRKYMDAGEFLEFARKLEIPIVPTLYQGPFSAEKILPMSEGMSVMPGTKHIREGIVVKPWVERRDNRIGRVALKLAGQGYLLRKQSDD